MMYRIQYSTDPEIVGWYKQYLFPRKIFTLEPIFPNSEVSEILLNECKLWCSESLGVEQVDWCIIGHTVFSYALCTKQAEDILAFKIRFGF